MYSEDRFISNNFGIKEFKDMNFGTESSERIVIIAGVNKPTIEILDATGLNEEERDGLVEGTLSYITSGCNYRYRVAGKIGNIYFCDMCTIDEKLGNHNNHSALPQHD